MTFSTWIALALSVSLSTFPDIPFQSVDELVQTGTIALRDRRYTEAEAAWREVLKRDPKNYDAYIQLGDSLRSRQSDAAKVAYQKAIDLAPKRAEGYLRLAELLIPNLQTNGSEAIAVYRQAIARAEPSAEVYYSLGMMMLYDPLDNRVFSSAEKDATIEAFRKATQIKSLNTTYVAASYVMLGDRFLQGQAQIDAYQAAIDLNNPGGYRGYANLLERQNRLSEIVPLYQQAIQKNLTSPYNVSFQSSLADVFMRLKRWNEAEVIYRKLHKLNPDYYFELGDVLKNQGKSDESLLFYKQVTKMVYPDSLSDPYDIGERLKDRGLLDIELKTYQKAVEIAPKNHRFYSLLGKALKVRGKPDEAFVAIRRSIALNPYAESGKVLEKQGKLEDAEKSLRIAISAYDDLRTGLSDKNKVLLAETQATTYQILQKVLVLQNRTNEALEVAEQGRSRAFAELLATRLSKTPIPDLEKATKSPNLDQIRSIAKTQNATLVEYSIIDQKQIYIWVIKPNGSIIFKTSELKESVAIAQLVADSRASIRIESAPTARSRSDFNLSLQQLHQTLIAPIAAELPSDPNQSVIFLPQGELFLVPFPALQDANKNPLIAQNTLSTAPSIQTLQLTHEKAALTKPGQQNLVVGNPTMPIFQSTQLPDLPGAKNEAIAIAKLLNTEPLLGDQATKSQVLAQMPTASIIHLATHGLLNPINGDIPGAIALAPNGTDNGFLSAREIFDLKLTANLAVLSACDTGRGEITSDGVIGLSRSFIAAGVPSVIVSLWAVNDNSTNVLMSHFYRNLKTNPNKAQSLRQAMLTTMKQYPDPKYWAAFTLIGET